MVHIESQSVSKTFILYLCPASDHHNWSILCHNAFYIISISGVSSPHVVHIESQSVSKPFILYLCPASAHRNWSILCHNQCLSPLYFIDIWRRLTARGPYCVTISV